MKSIFERILFWAPRLLGILLVLFISLFATDVFSEGYDFWDSLLAFLIHMIPSAVILVILIIAWRWELPGGILAIGLGSFYLFNQIFGQVSLATILIIALPLFIIGIFFLAHWFYRNKPQPGC